ncbi:hypothetical protein [Deinococcus sp. NW-56]|uniref:hypothetical protein n=1 Tax=Deinococcus sp. NW-56 TaxID=2080419 RepID=UPI000CF52F90|nr:hypothetical protein [Deinococcus sp. NW-56]
MTQHFAPTPGTPAVYTLDLDSFATGEGRLIQVLGTVASSEEEAQERFWETFWADSRAPHSTSARA